MYEVAKYNNATVNGSIIDWCKKRNKQFYFINAKLYINTVEDLYCKIKNEKVLGTKVFFEIDSTNPKKSDYHKGVKEMKKCCWNCIYCDTFTGVCHQDKFIEDVKYELTEFNCEKFKGGE